MLVDPAESPYELAVHEENRARVERALRRVPEPFRTTIILRDIEGFVYEEVAAIQGINLGTVKSRLVRGRACLKALLAPAPGHLALPCADRDRVVSWRGGAMNGCNQVQAGLTDYLDGRLTGRKMQEVNAHLRDCRECSRDWTSLREMQAVLAGLGPAKEPADLPLRIRVAVSRERARSRRGVFGAWNLAWRNAVGPFLLQAGAGFASAVLLLGTVIILVSMFAQPETAQAASDEPLGNATAPRLLYTSDAAGFDQTGANSSPVVVEAYINEKGKVYDYRIVSGPTDAATRSEVENLLQYSFFAPARFFGQAVRGLEVLSFSDVSVRG